MRKNCINAILINKIVMAVMAVILLGWVACTAPKATELIDTKPSHTIKRVEGNINVVSIIDGTWVDTDKMFLAGYVSNKSREIIIESTGEATPKIVEVKQDGVFGENILLREGMNVVGLKSGTDSAKIRVFFTPDINTIIPPEEFVRFYVHKEKIRQNCAECHRVNAGNGKFNFARLIPVRSDCLDCHEQIRKRSKLHGPVEFGACIACHSPHGTVNKSLVPRTGGELCWPCHKRKDEFNQKVVHAPVKSGCSDCHDPHGSVATYQLKIPGDGVNLPIAALCFQCHEPAEYTKKYSHLPVKEGDCTACHNPHSSQNSSLLVKSMDRGELCLMCHEDKKDTLSSKHSKGEKYCVNCHDPHSSDNNQFRVIKTGFSLDNKFLP